MPFERIKAILLQEWYITRKSLEVILDLFYFSLINIIVFGFVFTFLSKQEDSVGAVYILLGMILWEVIRITQYSISVGALWNIWSRNLSNMFIAPLTIFEYLAAAMLSGAIKTIPTVLIISAVAYFIFNFNIFTIGIVNLGLFFVNLSLFAWSVGITILAIIFRYGQRLQALAWGLIFLFQPLTAVFFPVSILPDTLKTIAYLLPPTYVFEAARAGLSNPSVNWQATTIAFAGNIVYLLISLWFFNYMLKKSKDIGQFARNEG
ncbi:MAG: ABC transporter permease [Candidatus Levybacteria bacterium]|nr:ABC transporter permease [Candidatus Levybacteria bacterium]